MTTPYQAAIIGAGIGAAHLQGYQQLPDRFAIHTICDIDNKRGQALAAKCKDTVFTSNMADVMVNPEIDIIDICLPPHLHYSACCDALQVGKHVICEKPLVSSLSEADKLITLAEKSPGQFSPVFQYRFGKGFAQLRALIDAGLADKHFTASLETHWHRPKSYYDIPWRGTWQGEQGGAVLGHAIHIHDLLSYIMGPVKRLSAFTTTRVNDIEVEDCAVISIELASGALATSSITLGAADNTSRLRFCFEGFTAESGAEPPYAPADGDWVFTAREPTEQAEIDRILGEVKPILSGYAGFFSAFADVLDGQPSTAVTLADARRSLEFVTAVYHSARSGNVVELPLSIQHPLYDSWLPAV